MTHAIRFHATGGPEVLRWEGVEVAPPGPGEALVRHTAVGVNFIDTYHRTGLYPLPMPSGLGMEAAGVVEAVGEGVSEVRAGQRVAYACQPVGAYAEARTIRACLLYTSDAADDLPCVDIGGRRSIQKKTKKTNTQRASIRREHLYTYTTHS